MSIKIFKNIENAIRKIERDNAFYVKWYSIFVNPYFISRYHLLKHVKKIANAANARASVLDVGCGTKPYQNLFKTKKYIGIDVQGGGHADKDKEIDAFFDGENIPFDDSSFDVVLSTEVFEHAKHLEKLMAEIVRVTKPGGTIFVTMPFVWPEHEKPYDFRRFTSFGHLALLENFNLRLIYIEPTTGIFGTIGQILSDYVSTGLYGLADKMSSNGIKYKFKFILFRVINVFICFPLLLFFLTLDFIFRRSGITLDYVFVSQKVGDFTNKITP